MVPLLFEATATDFSTRGLFALSDAISCTVTEERNGLFELELVYPTDGNHFSEITEDRLIVAFPHENGTKQAFRIYRREASIDGTVTFYARHISYQLSFIPVDLCSGQTDSAQTMMETLAQAAQVACPFSFESDITTAAALSFAVTAPVGFRSALGGMEGSVLDHFGGEFEWDNWTVRLLENRGSDNGVRIAYGKNITEYDDALDIGDTITGVMAYYAYTDENEQAQIVYTNPKVITNGSTEFAHERIAPLDCSGEFDSVPTVQALTDYATLWLHRTSNADPTQEINVSFVPLGQTAEYTGLAELERVSLCDTVKVSYPALGISVKKKVTRTVWNVLSNSYDEITLGTEQTLADTIVELQSGDSSFGSSSGGGSASAEAVDFSNLCTFPKGTPGHFSAFALGGLAFISYQGPAVSNYAAQQVLVTVPQEYAFDFSTFGQQHNYCSFNTAALGTVAVSYNNGGRDIFINQKGTTSGNVRCYFQICYPIKEN